MAQWIALTPSLHQQSGWHKFTDYRFSANDHMVTVAMAELTQVLPWYPLALVFNEPLNRYHLVALLSLQPGRNAYLSPDNKWLAPYIPSHFRGYPFGLNAQGELCIDAESGLLSEPAGFDAQPFYDEHGELVTTLQQVSSFHKERQKSLATTQALVDQLHQAELIKPWAIQWRPDANAPQKLQTLKGFCGIDEDQLRALSPEVYAELARTGALGLAYAQLFSRPRVADVQLRQRRLPKAQPTQERHLHAVEATESLDTFFEGNEDDLEFDFDR